jgi:hypothetical protein
LEVAGEEDDEATDADKSADETALREALHAEAIERWEAEQPEEVRAAAIAAYIESDTVDPEASGLSAAQVEALEAGYRAHVENTIAKPLGLDVDTWSEFISDDDLPAFREAVVRGDWELLRGHAMAVSEHLRREAQRAR